MKLAIICMTGTKSLDKFYGLPKQLHEVGTITTHSLRTRTWGSRENIGLTRASSWRAEEWDFTFWHAEWVLPCMICVVATLLRAGNCSFSLVLKTQHCLYPWALSVKTPCIFLVLNQLVIFRHHLCPIEEEAEGQGVESFPLSPEYSGTSLPFDLRRAEGTLLCRCRNWPIY